MYLGLRNQHTQQNIQTQMNKQNIVISNESDREHNNEQTMYVIDITKNNNHQHSNNRINNKLINKNISNNI